MSAVLKTRIRSEIELAATPTPTLAVAPTPETSHTVAPGAASPPSPSLRCPRCRRTLVPVRAGELQCTRPARPHSYPIVAGIPDLRAIHGADLTVARERADARLLAEVLARPALNADAPGEHASLLAAGETFIEDRAGLRGAAALRDGDEVLNEWGKLDQDSPELRMVLNIGCGSGELLEAAARRWPVCVGVDDGLRRLVLVRHRLQQAGVRARLVCAQMDALPFTDGLFDRIMARSILELAPRKERALREWQRMLSTQGRLWISTSNRWSVSRDPQLGIPALSWLPMRLLDLWAKWHGLTVPQRALVGTKRLRRLLEETGFVRVRLGEPVPDESNRTASTHRHAMGPGRRSLYDLAVIREIAKRVNPTLLATAGAAPGMRSRVAFDRYIARSAL